jgi:hypothetical protein
MNTLIRIPTVDSHYDNEAGHYKSDHVLSVKTTVYRGTQLYARMGLGGWTKKAEGRIVYEGPMVKGPYAFTYGLASVLAANPKHGTGYESEQMKKAGTEHEVEEGDFIVMAGTTYIVHITRCGIDAWIELIKKA